MVSVIRHLWLLNTSHIPMSRGYITGLGVCMYTFTYIYIYIGNLANNESGLVAMDVFLKILY